MTALPTPSACNRALRGSSASSVVTTKYIAAPATIGLSSPSAALRLGQLPDFVRERQAVEERAAKLAKKQAYPVGRKQKRDLREVVMNELMPRALARRRITRGWVDRDHGLLAVDAASDPKAEQFVENLRRADDNLGALRLDTQRSPASAMAEWLAKGDAPGKFGIDQDLGGHVTPPRRAGAGGCGQISLVLLPSGLTGPC